MVTYSVAPAEDIIAAWQISPGPKNGNSAPPPLVSVSVLLAGVIALASKAEALLENL
jgi:hypothetical protein